MGQKPEFEVLQRRPAAVAQRQQNAGQQNQHQAAEAIVEPAEYATQRVLRV